MTTISVRSRPRQLFAAAALLALGATAAQAEPQQLRRLRGVYAPECGNPLRPRVEVLDDALVVRDQGKVLLTGRQPRPAPAGAFAPAGFEAALTSEVAPGEMMYFVFTRDASGLHVSVDGNARVMQTLPAALHGKRVRRCDP